MIHVCTPYRLDKNLGKAYNDEFKKIGNDDWVCMHDWDVKFLLSESISHLYGYVERFPKADVFTCFANRSHANSTQQLLGGKVSDNADMYHHLNLAIRQKEFLYQATEITGNISGFLMLISKRLWKEIKFTEDMKCLGVDTWFSKCLRENGKKVLRMDGIYIWHTYRLLNGVRNKQHLL